MPEFRMIGLFAPQNKKNFRILHDMCPKKLTKCPNFTIFARKIFFPNFDSRHASLSVVTVVHSPTFAFSQIGDKDACFLAALILL